MLEVIITLALASTLLVISISGLGLATSAGNLPKTAKLIEQEMMANMAIARITKQTLKLEFAEGELKKTATTGTDKDWAAAKVIQTPRGISFRDIKFGLYGTEAQFFPGGTVSPGSLTIVNQAKEECHLKVSLRGKITTNCRQE